MKVKWPQFCRAEASKTAYQWVLHQFQTKPFAEAVERVHEKIAEKDAIIRQYTTQGDSKDSPQEMKP